MSHQKILILDFGSQVTQLIARRVREAHVFCEVVPCDVGNDWVRAYARDGTLRGVILSGSHASTYEEHELRAPQAVFELGIPVLGICYGMQTMAMQMGGNVEASDKSEFGYAEVTLPNPCPLFDGIEDRINDSGTAILDVWMSHGDKVVTLPSHFIITAATETAPIAAMSHVSKPFFGIQFHPEVTHTSQGLRILERFVRNICGCEALWTSANIIEDAIARVRAQVGSDHVLLGLSGGVDSSVVAALLHKAIGDQLTCVFVDNGLLRLNEGDQVMATFAKNMGVKVIRSDSEAKFLGALAGVSDPELKRKAIGNTFIEVFDEEASKIHNV